MIVTYIVIGPYGYYGVWIIGEEPDFWDADPYDNDGPSDCLWIVPGTID